MFHHTKTHNPNVPNSKLMITKEPHIFLDMDGVLTNFVGGVEKVFDTDLSELNTWNVATYLGISSHEFWGKIRQHPHFWAELEPYPWARDLVGLCQEKTKGNVSIATSPTADPNCAGQKMWWIGHRYPGFRRSFLIGSQKYLLAKPHHLLIDDSNDNCVEFGRYGGEVVVFPQKWNAGSGLMKEGETRLEFVERVVDNFVQLINKD